MSKIPQVLDVLSPTGEKVLSTSAPSDKSELARFVQVMRTWPQIGSKDQIVLRDLTTEELHERSKQQAEFETFIAMLAPTGLIYRR